MRLPTVSTVTPLTTSGAARCGDAVLRACSHARQYGLQDRMRVLGIPARRIHRQRTPSTVPFRRRGRVASGCKPLEPVAPWRMIRAASRIPLRRPACSDRRAGDSAVRSREAIVQVSDLHNLDGVRGPPAQADRKARVPRGRPPNAAAQAAHSPGVL